MKIIFNADDFGMSKGVNLGIVEAHKNGPVRSATIMAGMDAFNHAVQLAKENPSLKVGVHLTLNAGKSVGGVYQTITDKGGNFFSIQVGLERIKKEIVDFKEVEREFEAQIQKVLNAGIAPSHLDSHHHVHNHPEITQVFIRVAKKYGIKRVRLTNGLSGDDAREFSSTDRFDASFFGENITIEHLKQIISKGNGQSLEIMTHPAYLDNALCKISSYHQKRMLEMEILTSKELKDFLNSGGYEIVSFEDLSDS